MTYDQSVKLAKQDRDELPWLLTYGHLQNRSRAFLREWLRNDTHLFDQYNSTADFEILLKIVRKLFVVS